MHMYAHIVCEKQSRSENLDLGRWVTLSWSIPLHVNVNYRYVHRTLSCSVSLHVNVNYVHRTVVVVS